MKIIYIIHQFYPEYYTGTEKFVLSIANMMQRLGNRVRVITYSSYDDLSDTTGSDTARSDTTGENLFVREFLYKGIPVTAFNYKRLPEDLNYGFTSPDLAKAAYDFFKKEKPDIVHVGHPMRTGELIKALKLQGIPYIITLTDFWLLCPKHILLTASGNLCSGPEKGKACKKFCPEFPAKMISQRIRSAKDVLAGAKRVLSPSRFLADIFKKEFTDINIGIINHGISYCRIEKNSKIYKKDDGLTFFYGGSFNRFKGLHLLIDAFTKISSDRILLKIYGSGGADKEYNMLLKKMAENDARIQFCGVFSEDQVGRILKSVDVAVVPSLWYENYPLVLHEALACNVPVIASDAGGMAEKTKNGVNGFTFQIGSADHLKKVLKAITDDPEMLNSLKENIKNHMMPTIEQEAYAYEREYKRAVLSCVS